MNLITILGPTATGKTRLAALVATKYNGEVISADSRQVYIELNIGTGKDYDQYLVNDQAVPFHLIDISDPRNEYSVFHYKRDFMKSYLEITGRNKQPILCGGTGLYLSSVLLNYNLPKITLDVSALEGLSDGVLRNLLLSKKGSQHNITDLEDRDRIIKALLVAEAKGESSDTSFITSLNIGVNPGRKILKERISRRLSERLKSGMVDEVERLLKKGISKERLILLGLEYKYLALYISGELKYNDMFQKLESAIHAFAKRQMTWFRKMEREGLKIFWIENPDPEIVSGIIKENF